MPTRYFNGLYDPVFGTIEQGAAGDGTSTWHFVGDQLIVVHQKSTRRSSEMAVRYMTRVDCEELSKIRSQNQRKYRNLLSTQGGRRAQ